MRRWMIVVMAGGVLLSIYGSWQMSSTWLGGDYVSNYKVYRLIVWAGLLCVGIGYFLRVTEADKTNEENSKKEGGV